MRVVVRRTGLNPSLLRAWERRYGAVGPGRSDGGQRLYSEDDIQRLSLLRTLVEMGHNIGQVAGLADEDLGTLLHSDPDAPPRGAGSGGRDGSAGGGSPDSRGSAPYRAGPWGREVPPGYAQDGGARGWAAMAHPAREVAERRGGELADAYLDDALAAVRAMDPRALDSVLNRASMALGPGALVDGLLVPLLATIGALWKQGSMQPALEHVASGILRRFLYGLVDRLAPPPGGPVMVVGTPAGHRHEFGAQLAAVVGAGAGWDVLLLGADLPAAEIASAAARKGARVVALSALHPVEDPRLLPEMLELRERLDAGVHLLVGGPAAIAVASGLEESGIEVLESLDHLRLRAAVLRGEDESRRTG
jgi:MerR family transcriptional regulator, light-induced transcriptional regulator